MLVAVMGNETPMDTEINLADTYISGIVKSAVVRGETKGPREIKQRHLT